MGIIENWVLHIRNKDKIVLLGFVLISIPLTIFCILIFLGLISIIYFKKFLFDINILSDFFPLILACLSIGYAIILFRTPLKSNNLSFKRNSVEYYFDSFPKIDLNTSKPFECIKESKISRSKRLEIIKSLHLKHVDLPCPRCGYKKFSIFNGYFDLSFHSSDCDSIEHSIVMVCRRCGYLSQHSIRMLDNPSDLSLRENPQEKDEE